MPRRSPAELLERARAGERGAVARLISLVEQGGEGAEEVGRLCYPLGGQMLSIGLTGAPGAGKSTLTGGLIGVLRSQGVEVAVLAIDPSSPFSGGAILGDRVRMQEHFLDAGVFIRSMATRGHLGGLAASTSAAVNVLAQGERLGFAIVRDAVGRAGVARGAVHDGWLGVTAVTVSADRRRSGVGRQVEVIVVRSLGTGIGRIYLRRPDFWSLKSNRFFSGSRRIVFLMVDSRLNVVGMVSTITSIVGAPSPMTLGTVFPVLARALNLTV